MKDKCVCCDIDTSYEKEIHIDFRIGYIEGAGQLCLDCYDDIYINKNKVKEKNEESSMEWKWKIYRDGG